jgi:two-component system cell cycle sensor histidine kinase PleC
MHALACKFWCFDGPPNSLDPVIREILSVLLILLLVCGLVAAAAVVIGLRLSRSGRDSRRRLGQLQAAIEALGDGFELYDRDDRLVMCNHRFRALQPALPADGGIGLSFRAIIEADIKAGRLAIPPADSAEWVEHQLRRRRGSLYEQDFPYTDGGVVRVVMQRLPDGSMVGTRTDITDLKRRELQLDAARQDAEAANRTKSRFLATMSHELRTPLNAVIGFSDVLRGELLGPIGSAKYRDYASHIHDSAVHLLNVLSDILDMSKVEAGKISLNESVVDVAALLREVVELFEQEAGFAKVALTLSLPPSLPPLFADQRYLRQMLINLLSNALKFTPAGGRIEIAVTADVTADGAPDAASDLAISVADTGVGMTEAQLEIALAPFGQIDSPLMRKYTGTGLGLPIVKSLIELHGGRLAIASKPGEGTRVSLIFPGRRLQPPAPPLSDGG